MKPRVLVISGLSLAVVIVAFAVMLNLLTTPPASPQAADAPGTPSSSLQPATPLPSASALAPSPKVSKAAPAVSAKPSVLPSVNPKAPAAVPDPQRPLEVAPPAQKSTSAALPKSRDDGPLVKSPLPAEGSASGKIVAGFPTDVIEAAPASALKSSSVSPQGSILQVSLVAHSTAEPLAVMQFYQKQFAQLGLGAAQAPASAGSSAMWFTLGTDKITVTTTPRQDGGTEYSVFGILHAES